MAKKKYRAAPGAMYDNKQAAALGRTLESLAASSGVGSAKLVPPEALVDAASDPDSPVHGLFEWDDSAAARKHRIQQARTHINHLEIEIVISGSTTRTRALHSVRISTGERGYATLGAIQTQPELAEQVIQRAQRELNGWKERYSQYDDVFGGVIKEIAKANLKVFGGRRKKAAIA